MPVAVSRSFAPGQPAPDPATAHEWLLTNSRASFSMGTISAGNTRRYHALLVSSLQPPVRRIVALAALAEYLILEPATPRERQIELSVFRFASTGRLPGGTPHLASFDRDVSARWTFAPAAEPGLRITRTLHLFDDTDTITLRYAIQSPVPARLIVRPLCAMRDFHALLPADHDARRIWSPVDEAPGGARVCSHDAALRMRSHGAAFSHDPRWWHAFEYPVERDRGYDWADDLLCPGTFTHNLPAADPDDPAVVELTATTDDAIDLDDPPSIEADRRARLARIAAMAKAARRASVPVEDAMNIASLCAAADQYIVARQLTSPDAPATPPKNARRPAKPSPAPRFSRTIIAGYPWFADWGRDTLISLPGLLLATGRHDEALDVLCTFARARRDGVIPNRFDDYAGEAHYNTADASLWFLQAATAYRHASGDRKGFDSHLRDACLDVIRAYRAGTLNDIRSDADALITAGSPSTQLTWMDAQRDNRPFTPRHGKPVEINALWHSGLLAVADALPATLRRTAAELRTLANTVRASFRKRFWNPAASCLYDVLTPGPDGSWTPDPAIRPNQVFAVSLPGELLTPAQRRQVVDVVRAHLFTPHAVRSLSPQDPAYRPRYEGAMSERDAAYHNGTAWPWLVGPLAEATLRAGSGTAKAAREARALLQPLLNYLYTGECPGQLPEVFDADHSSNRPQRAGGCPAQAWSVAETLRVLSLLCAQTRSR